MFRPAHFRYLVTVLVVMVAAGCSGDQQSEPLATGTLPVSESSSLTTVVIPDATIPPDTKPTVPVPMTTPEGEELPPYTFHPRTTLPPSPPPETLPPPTTMRERTSAGATYDTPEKQGEAAAASLGMNADDPIPGWTVRYMVATDSQRGVTDPKGRTVDIYVKGSEPLSRTAHTLAHEVGHTIDMDGLDEPGRLAWKTIRDPGGVHQWVVESNDMASLAGDFAETCAWQAAGQTEWGSTITDPPGASELETFNRITNNACNPR